MSQEPTMGELDRKIDNLKAHVDTGFTGMRDELSRQRHAMFGNGGPGFSGQLIELKGRVSVLEQCAEKLDDRSFKWRMAQWGWVIAIGLAILSFLAEVL